MPTRRRCSCCDFHDHFCLVALRFSNG